MDLIQSISGLGAAGVIVGLVTAIKPLVKNHAWLPIISIILGILINILVSMATIDLLNAPVAKWVASVLVGILVGLSASGLYSGGQEIKREGL